MCRIKLITLFLTFMQISKSNNEFNFIAGLLRYTYVTLKKIIYGFDLTKRSMYTFLMSTTKKLALNVY